MKEKSSESKNHPLEKKKNWQKQVDSILLSLSMDRNITLVQNC